MTRLECIIAGCTCLTLGWAFEVVSAKPPGYLPGMEIGLGILVLGLGFFVWEIVLRFKQK